MKYQEKVFITKLEKTYSILSAAFKLAVEENGSASNWGLTSSEEGSNIFFENMKPYLNIAKDCGIDKVSQCLPDRYCDYLGDFLENTSTHINKSRVVILSDGSLLSFIGEDSNHALFPDGHIYVDLNGKQLPNRQGVDYFGFYIYDNSLYPLGELKPKRNALGWNYCNSKSNVGAGLSYGQACTAWVLTNKNMDYIRCRTDLDWSSKTSCKQK